MFLSYHSDEMAKKFCIEFCGLCTTNKILGIICGWVLSNKTATPTCVCQRAPNVTPGNFLGSRIDQWCNMNSNPIEIMCNCENQQYHSPDAV